MEEEDGDDSHEEGQEDNFIDDANEDRKCKSLIIFYTKCVNVISLPIVFFKTARNTENFKKKRMRIKMTLQKKKKIRRKKPRIPYSATPKQLRQPLQNQRNSLANSSKN